MSNAIYSAMAAILKDVDAIEKTRSSTGSFSFKFRGIDDAMNTLHDVFAKHQVFITHEILEHTMHERTSEKVYNGNKETKLSFHHIVKAAFRFWHADGSNVSAIGIGEAADSGDKGAGKAMSYALKVCLLQTFLIPTEEQKDPDYEQHEFKQPAPKQSVKEINKEMVKRGATEVPSPKPAPEKPDVFETKVFVWETDKNLVNEAIKQLGVPSKEAKEHGANLRTALEREATNQFASIKEVTAAYFQFVGVLSNG